MHILLIHQAFAAINEPGGTRHHELALYMASRGHCVTIITSPVSYLTGKLVQADENKQTPQIDGVGWVKIIRPPVYQALHRSFIHRVINFLSFMASSFNTGLRVKDVDIVWGTTPPLFQGVTAWMLARLKRVPFLFEVRDLWPAFAVAVGVLKNPFLIKASEWLEQFLYRRADTLVVNSPGFIEHVASRGAKTVELVPNGADTQMFFPEENGAGFRELYGLEDKYVALYAGAHGMSNDLDVLLDSAQLLRENPDIAIVLVGDGKEKERLQARATDMRLENIFFVPPVPKDKMAETLAAADTCIGILRPIEMYKTVYPNKIFDYMAAGRPVLLAMDGVIREVVESAQCGVVVPSGDATALSEAISLLAGSPQKGRILGQNGRTYIETHFDRQSLAEKMLSIMKKQV